MYAEDFRWFFNLEINSMHKRWVILASLFTIFFSFLYIYLGLHQISGAGVSLLLEDTPAF